MNFSGWYERARFPTGLDQDDAARFAALASRLSDDDEQSKRRVMRAIVRERIEQHHAASTGLAPGWWNGTRSDR